MQREVARLQRVVRACHRTRRHVARKHGVGVGSLGAEGRVSIRPLRDVVEARVQLVREPCIRTGVEVTARTRVAIAACLLIPEERFAQHDRPALAAPTKDRRLLEVVAGRSGDEFLQLESIDRLRSDPEGVDERRRRGPPEQRGRSVGSCGVDGEASSSSPEARRFGTRRRSAFTKPPGLAHARVSEAASCLRRARRPSGRS